MKKSFLVAIASMLTLGLSNSMQAMFFAPWGYQDAVVITTSPFYVRPVTYYPAYPVYYEMDPKAALFSTGVTASVLSFALGVCGVAQIAEGISDFVKGYVSPDNDGAEFPRGVVAVSGATLLGAVAIAALQTAAK